ncbi:MAG: Gfo/Idh/MocA family oxidoreductase [Longicatena sp.]
MNLRYGIITCATITDRFMHAVLEYGDTLVAIASRSLEKAQEKAQAYGIKAYGSYEELYKDEHIDVVYIASNNATHVQEIKQALHHGLHVICEKPIALSKEQANEVFELAKEKGLFLMEAQKSVFLPVMQDIKQHIQAQTFGHLHQIEMSCSFPSPSSPWMHDPTQGGVVYGSANYTLELLDYVLEPKTTTIQASGLFESTQACERVSMNIVMDDTLINSRISMNGDTLHHAIFYFDQGYIHVPSYWKAREYTIHTQQQTTTIQHPVDYEMIYEVAHIHECIEKGLLESPIMSAKRSITCCTLVDEINSQIRKS